jgi:CMP-N-acetylneuraminic acid synthetase
MKTLAIIPARGGSKRVPRKNIRLLGGKPLVARTIEAAFGAKTLDRIVVSSDSSEVLNIARSYDMGVALPRPAEFATDTSPAILYVKHALEALEGTEGGDPFEAIVILQPSSPFTLPEDIDGTVRLLKRTGADSAVSITQLDHAIHPFKLKILKGDRLIPYLEEEEGRMAAHELPPLYVRNCSVYATRRTIVDSGQTIGSDCRGYLMPPERSVDINTELDFLFAEFLVNGQLRDSNAAARA